LDFLLNLVKESSDQNIFFIKKYFNDKPLYLDDEIIQGLNNMIYFLMESLLFELSEHIEHIKFNSEFYICNIITGECTCREYIWNSSLRDKCRHYHAAILYKEVQDDIGVTNKIKKELVQYFRNKERLVPAFIKNNVIYYDTIENSFQEIIRLYNIHGKISNFFFLKKNLFINI